MRAIFTYVFTTQTDNYTRYAIKPKTHYVSTLPDIYGKHIIADNGDRFYLDMTVIADNARYDFTVPCLDKGACKEEYKKALSFIGEREQGELDIEVYYIDNKNKHKPLFNNHGIMSARMNGEGLAYA